MNIRQKVSNYLLKPRFHFSRFQFNLVALFFMSLGLVAGTYLTLSEIFPRVFALNDSAKVWTFSSANSGDYTTSLTLVDDNGAQPTGGTVGANEFTNPAFASDNSSWSVAADPTSGWVEIPGDATYSTTNFLAMQYEAKYDCTGDDDGNTAAECQSAGVCTAGDANCSASSGLGLDYLAIGSFDTANVVSTANGAPLVHITQPQAIAACPSGTHLITNTE